MKKEFHSMPVTDHNINNIRYFQDMKNIDSIMADILVGTWLFLSAVLCLNLLIALFSDTFQRYVKTLISATSYLLVESFSP